MKKFKVIPQFNNEDEERNFWDSARIEDYFDMSKPSKIDLSELRPSTRSITLRMPVELVDNLKLLARKKDVPYQSLLKVYLSERIEKEMK